MLNDNDRIYIIKYIDFLYASKEFKIILSHEITKMLANIFEHVQNNIVGQHFYASPT